MRLAARGLSVRRGAFELSADFETAEQGITVLFGPSGAGKSMLLSAVAGLTRLDAGRLVAGETVLEDVAGKVRVPAHRRDIGLLFQDARLFPHLSVLGNLRYAQVRAARDRAAPSIDEVAAKLEIGDLLNRPVRNLSGGEKGRVALARALLSAPRLLLLDEPFAALDGRRRRAFLALLRDINRIRGLPMMIVTHLVEDVAELADGLIGLRDGRVVAQGVASVAMHDAAFLDLLDRRDVGVRVSAGAITGADAQTGGGVWVRADSVMIAGEAPRSLSARNVWEGVVTEVATEADGAVLVGLDTRVGRVLSRITQQAAAELGLVVGRTAWAVVKTHAL